MNHIQDLFISRDIVTVFDHSLNDDTKALLHKIMESPLSSENRFKYFIESLRTILQK